MYTAVNKLAICLLQPSDAQSARPAEAQSAVLSSGATAQSRTGALLRLRGLYQSSISLFSTAQRFS